MANDKGTSEAMSMATPTKEATQAVNIPTPDNVTPKNHDVSTLAKTPLQDNTVTTPANTPPQDKKTTEKRGNDRGARIYGKQPKPTHYVSFEFLANGPGESLVEDEIKEPFVAWNGTNKAGDHLTLCILHLTPEEVAELVAAFETLGEAIKVHASTISKFENAVKYERYGRNLIGLTLDNPTRNVRTDFEKALALINPKFTPCDRYQWNPHVTINVFMNHAPPVVELIAEKKTEEAHGKTVEIQLDSLCLREMPNNSLLAHYAW